MIRFRSLAPRLRSAALATAFLVGAVGAAACNRRAPLPGQAASSVSRDDDEAGGLRFLERVTGGASASDPLPLVVAIHGRGGRPEMFGQVLSTLSVRARVILPYAPEPYLSGYTWFPDWNNDEEFADGTRKAADRLATMIGELSTRRPTVGKPIVTGFSQGGMLSFTLVALHPEVVGEAFPIGGLLARPLWPATWPANRPKPLVHAFHGTADDVVPVDGARGIVHQLVGLGFSAELTEYPGVRHRVPDPEARDVVRAIEDAVGQQASQSVR